MMEKKLREKADEVWASWDDAYEKMCAQIEGSKPIRDGKLTTYRMVIRKCSLGSTEYWTDKDYEEQEKRVEEAIKDGTYGQPTLCSLTLVHNPLFDDNDYIPPQYPLTPNDVIILDHGKQEP